MNQLPANVALHFIPGGNPPPMKEPRPLGILIQPKLEGGWAGRKWTWKILSFNGKPTQNNVFVVGPGDRCSISVNVKATWRFNSHDFCPGCIVQLYYGMENVFYTGIVENGIDNHNEDSTTDFVAPEMPGLYYINAKIDLMYNYVE